MQSGSSPPSGQLPLGIALTSAYTFDNFFSSRKEEAVHALRRFAIHDDEFSLFLWGPTGVGKTHLLQASCYAAAQDGAAVAYVPLSEINAYGPALLDGLDTLNLVALDDVGSVTGQVEWETALFDMYNSMRDQGRKLLIAGNASPRELPLKLPDLRSRFGWGPVYHLPPLDDAGRLEVLQLQARQRGLELPPDAAQFLLRRCPRDMAQLCALIERLDQASLAAQRRLTIPFVKSVIGG